jgi:competence protein ComEA
VLPPALPHALPHLTLRMQGRLLPQASPPAAAPQKTPPTQELVIDVVGAVRRPGLYRLGEGNANRGRRRTGRRTVGEGGPGESINLAAPIVDGQQVLVPRRARSGAAGQGSVPPSGTPATPTAPVSLSRATLEALDALPGVGPVTTELSLSPTVLSPRRG